MMVMMVVMPLTLLIVLSLDQQRRLTILFVGELQPLDRVRHRLQQLGV
jgi:hypothetical protein